MNSPEAPPADLLAGVPELLRQAGLEAPRFELKPLAGGANNRVYRLEREGQAPLVLKHYFFSPTDGRDRFHSESSFYHLIGAGTELREKTPRALAWDRKLRLGLFSWIEGRRLTPGEVTRDAVDQALGFYLALNAHQDRPEAAAVPEASEACFDLEQHFACAERRLSRLAHVEREDDLGRKVFEFISRQLRPAFDDYKRHAEASVAGPAVLKTAERCLSPSDFGFHNALRQNDGSLAFFDFEYAGWDDPAKFLCDFLCQPAVPVPRELWPHCFETLCRPIRGGTTRARGMLLLPLYHLKWCCILLNEFLPREQDRRVFSQRLTASEIEKKKREQLDKARLLFANFASGDPIRGLGRDETPV